MTHARSEGCRGKFHLGQVNSIFMNEQLPGPNFEASLQELEKGRKSMGTGAKMKVDLSDQE